MCIRAKELVRANTYLNTSVKCLVKVLDLQNKGSIFVYIICLTTTFKSLKSYALLKFAYKIENITKCF